MQHKNQVYEILPRKSMRLRKDRKALWRMLTNIDILVKKYVQEQQRKMKRSKQRASSNHVPANGNNHHDGENEEQVNTSNNHNVIEDTENEAMGNPSNNHAANLDTDNEEMVDLTGINTANLDTDNEVMADLSGNRNANTDNEDMDSDADALMNNNNPDAGDQNMNPVNNPSGNPNANDTNATDTNANDANANGPNEALHDVVSDINIHNIHHINLADYRPEDDDDYDPENVAHQAVGGCIPPIFGPSGNPEEAEEEKAAIEGDDDDDDDDEADDEADDYEHDNDDNDDNHDSNNTNGIEIGCGMWSPQYNRHALKALMTRNAGTYTLFQTFKGILAGMGLNLSFIDWRWHDLPRRLGYDSVQFYLHQ